MEEQAGLVERAARFARLAHAGQRRRASGRPYHVHPAAVAAILARYRPDDAELVAAGHLHDVLEESDADPALIGALFGGRVRRLVEAVTRRTDADPLERHRDPDVVCLRVADTLANVRETRAALRTGADPFAIFRGGRAKRAAWQRTADLAGATLAGDPLLAALHRALAALDDDLAAAGGRPRGGPEGVVRAAGRAHEPSDRH